MRVGPFNPPLYRSVSAAASEANGQPAPAIAEEAMSVAPLISGPVPSQLSLQDTSTVGPELSNASPLLPQSLVEFAMFLMFGMTTLMNGSNSARPSPASGDLSPGEEALAPQIAATWDKFPGRQLPVAATQTKTAEAPAPENPFQRSAVANPTAPVQAVSGRSPAATTTPPSPKEASAPRLPDLTGTGYADLSIEEMQARNKALSTTDIRNMVTEEARRAGMEPRAMLAQMKLESNGDPNMANDVVNGKAESIGLFQIRENAIDWMLEKRQLGSMTREQALALRYDPRMNTRFAILHLMNHEALVKQKYPTLSAQEQRDMAYKAYVVGLDHYEKATPTNAGQFVAGTYNGAQNERERADRYLADLKATMATA